MNAQIPENHRALGAPSPNGLITVDTAIGFELIGVKKRSVIQLMGSRVWGRFNPNHWDPVYAERTGLKSPIQTGEMCSAYIAEMCVNYFGRQFFVNARMTCKYINSIFTGEIITTHGIVRKKAPNGGGVRFTVETWADNEAGEKKAHAWIEVDVGT